MAEKHIKKAARDGHNGRAENTCARTNGTFSNGNKLRQCFSIWWSVSRAVSLGMWVVTAVGMSRAIQHFHLFCRNFPIRVAISENFRTTELHTSHTPPTGCSAFAMKHLVARSIYLLILNGTFLFFLQQAPMAFYPTWQADPTQGWQNQFIQQIPQNTPAITPLNSLEFQPQVHYEYHPAVHHHHPSLPPPPPPTHHDQFDYERVISVTNSFY